MWVSAWAPIIIRTSLGLGLGFGLVREYIVLLAHGVSGHIGPSSFGFSYKVDESARVSLEELKESLTRGHWTLSPAL